MTFAANSAPEPYRTIIAELEERIQHEIKVGCEAEEEIMLLRAALQEIADDSDPNGFIDRNTRRAREALTAAKGS